MATANGYVIVDDSYIAKRLGPEPATTTCTVSSTVTPSPWFYLLEDEAHACFRWLSTFREPFRLVSVEFDDPGDVAWPHSPGAVGDSWVDDGWTWIPVHTFDVVDELSPSEIRTIVSANLNPNYPPPARLLEIWGL